MQKGIAVRVRAAQAPGVPPPPERRRARRASADTAGQGPPDAAPTPKKPSVYTRRDFARCLVISLVVGTALVLINVRPTPGEGPDLGRIFINYLVPFLVASTSASFANAARIRAARK